MRKNHFQTIVNSLLCFVLLNACSKDDDFVNLESKISVESHSIGTTEGNFLIINLNLSEALSEDVILKGLISTDGIPNYINDDDYKKEFEYSSNNGATYNSENNKLMIRLKAGAKKYKIRIPTIDDEKMETNESFKMSLIIENIEKFKSLEFNNEELTLSVSDNDFDDAINKNYVGPPALMVFDITNNHSEYKIAYLSQKLDNPLQKIVIDGEYKKAVDDALKMFNLLPKDVNVVKFVLGFDTTSGLGGYVHNPNTEGKDEWIIFMNIALAYINVMTNEQMSYNEDGAYGNIFTHEFGHIATLNYSAEQVTHGVSMEDCITSNPSNLPLYEGCVDNPDAYLRKFNDLFYINESINEPTHVSNYAKTNIAEDIAETISHFITQEEIPESSTSSSSALQKINHIDDQDYFKSLKPKINEIFKLGLVGFNEEIFQYQVDGDGNRISCLDHEKLIEILEKKKQ